jgi:hypothetical protein
VHLCTNTDFRGHRVYFPVGDYPNLEYTSFPRYAASSLATIGVPVALYDSPQFGGPARRA